MPSHLEPHCLQNHLLQGFDKEAGAGDFLLLLKGLVGSVGWVFDW